MNKWMDEWINYKSNFCYWYWDQFLFVSYIVINSSFIHVVLWLSVIVHIGEYSAIVSSLRLFFSGNSAASPHSFSTPSSSSYISFSIPASESKIFNWFHVFLKGIINCVTSSVIIFTPVIIHHFIAFSCQTWNLSFSQILPTNENRYLPNCLYYFLYSLIF